LHNVLILGYFFSSKINRIEAVEPNSKVNLNIFSSTSRIIKTSQQTKSIFTSILGISWFWFFGASLLTLFPHYVRDYMNGNENVVTLFLAVFSIGVATGSIICERLSYERLELGLVPFGSIGLSIFVLDLFL